MKDVREIRRELDETAARRTELWHELSDGHDSSTAAEIARLTTRIEDLWEQLRQTRVRLRFGAPERILARARSEERIDRQLGTRIGAGLAFSRPAKPAEFPPSARRRA